MPSQIAHVLVGEAALSRADPGAARIYLGGSLAPYFRLGCQGPDLFYHSQRTRPVALHYGVLAHRRAFGKIVEGMAQTWVREDGDPVSLWAAFLLGFATHAALDRAAHPFIVYFSGWVDAARPDTARYRSCHAFLERILDTLLWEREKRLSVTSFETLRLLCPPGDVPLQFPERMALALENAYPAETGRDGLLVTRMANAFADSRRFFALTDPSKASRPRERQELYRHLDGPHGSRIVSVAYPEVFSRAVDWANVDRRAWTHPCQSEPERRESFFDLCFKAEREASELLRLLLSVFRTRNVVPDLPALAGNATLNVGNPDGKPVKPLFCRPLPLPEALQEELRMRKESALLFQNPINKDSPLQGTLPH